MIPSDLLFYSGIIVILVGTAVLLISGFPSDRKRTIFKDYPFGGHEGIVKPFRLQERGKLTCTLSDLNMVSGVRIFLTDLFPSIDIDYTWGPRYFQITNKNQQPETIDIGRGEYAFVIDSRGARYDGRFSIVFEYKEYPREKFAAWGLALIEVGAAMSLVGIAT